MPTRPLAIATALFIAAWAGLMACAGEGPGDHDQAADAADPRTAPAQRPDQVTDTLMLEGMPEPIALTLFTTPDDFPLAFSAYVPEDMATEASIDDDDGASVRFIAVFGGIRNPRAFVHFFVHPDGTDPQQALAVVRAYEAHTGVPVGRGLEPLPPPEAARRMAWADHAYTFRYQAAGAWYLGTIGLGSRHGRMFHLVTHYPAEYGDGFGPRADLILQSWHWADGQPLHAGPRASDVTIPSARPDSLPPEE